MGIGQHLNLDVVTGGQIAFAEHRRITERRLRLTARGLHFATQGGQFVHHPHAAAATARGRLDQHRQLGLGDGVGVELVEHRHSGGGHQLFDSILEPIARTASTGGPTQVSPASATAVAKSAFSERNPYPGCSASAPAARAAPMMASMLR